ncbi:MAG: phosphatidylglycerophosphatase A [bacterium]|nr:phosphatidylglycerophosphatase A [bacterium]
MKKIWLIIATFFNIGRLPILGGTITSLVLMLLVYFIKPYWNAPFYIQIPIVVAIFILGIPASSVAEKHFNTKDPRPCVIDEVAGQMVALLLVPHNIYFYCAGFFLFRVFDILKPPPVSTAEKIPGGFGIMFDDIVAGLYALAILQIYIYFFY